MTHRKSLALGVAVALLLWFGALELRGLFMPDEGRYAEIPREMAASGDWITPRLNGFKYFEKPPLQYWMTAISFRLFGEDEWTARLPGALLGFLSVLVAAFCAARLWSVRTGIWTGAVLASSWGYFLGAQYLTLDIALSAFLTISLCGFLMAQAGELEPRAAVRWLLLAWAAAALAVLTKGLIGIVLPGLALTLYALIYRDTAPIRKLLVFRGVALFLAIAAPWFILVQLRNPEFFDFFFVNEHLRRFAAAGHHRPGGWWYYLPVLLVGLMPWTPVALRWLLQLRAGFALRRSGSFSATGFCVLWILSVVVFFSLSRSKLPAYVLPAVPAIAMLIAKRLEEPVGNDDLKWSSWSTAAMAILLLSGVPFLSYWPKFAAITGTVDAELSWLYSACVALLLGALIAARLAHARRKAFAIAALALASQAFLQIVLVFFHTVDAHFSAERLAESITPEGQSFRPEAPFFSVATFDHSLPFYLRRTVTLVATRGELGPGIDAEPHRAIGSLEEFRSIWLGMRGQAFAILSPSSLRELRFGAFPSHEVVADARSVIVSRYPEAIPRFAP